MKKLIVILTLLFTTTLYAQKSEAKIILRDLDFWELESFPYVLYDDELRIDVIRNGYYLIPTKQSKVIEYMGEIFKPMDFPSNCYIPFYYDLSDNISLFYVSENTIFTDNEWNDMQDLAYEISFELETLVYDRYIYDYYHFYCKEIPYDSPPFFDDINEITVQLSHNLSLSSIVSSIKAYDYKDGDVSNNIKIKSENYSINKHNGGVYYVTLEVSDSSGNLTTKTYDIIVIDDLDPTISGYSTLIISKTYELDIFDIKQNINAYSYKGESLPIFILDDNYSINKNTPGLYDVIFYAIDSNNREVYHTIKINVIDYEIPFYTYDFSKVTMLENKNITSFILIDILKLIKNIEDYFEIEVDSRIEENTKGKYDVFYELYDYNGDVIENIRIVFIFLNSSEDQSIVIKENKNFIIPILISTSLLAAASIGIIYYKKRNN